MSPHIRSMMGENHLSVREPANPRVLALHYRVANNDDVIYRAAERSVHRRDGFDLVMDDGRVVLEFHDHYPSEESARAGVRDFIDEWEFQADLAIGAREFRLEFVRAEIVDRHPVLGDRHVPSWVTLASMRLPAIPFPVDYSKPPVINDNTDNGAVMPFPLAYDPAPYRNRPGMVRCRRGYGNPGKGVHSLDVCGILGWYWLENCQCAGHAGMETDLQSELQRAAGHPEWESCIPGAMRREVKRWATGR